MPDADLDSQREVIDAFRAAAREGDFEALLEVLDPDVVLRVDEGALPIGASRLVHGAATVARQAFAFSRLDVEVRPALVNGAAGTVALRDGKPFAIAGFTIRNRRIVEMDVLADPERLRHIDLTILH
jgi:RNA polymerase sigma-70 factor (ECF subfamily)